MRAMYWAGCELHFRLNGHCLLGLSRRRCGTGLRLLRQFTAQRFVLFACVRQFLSDALQFGFCSRVDLDWPSCLASIPRLQVSI